LKGNEEKNRFRRSKEWKDFRKKLIQERGTYCQCCGKKTKILDCHHADEEHYKDLNPEKFFLVCKMCHKCISALEMIKPENWYKIRTQEWVDFYKRFLIVEPRPNLQSDAVSSR
jgi:hypothetical protein